MDENDDYSAPGLPVPILLHPLEVTALSTLGEALNTLQQYYRNNNRGRRDADYRSDCVGRRHEFEDALAVIERLGARLYEDKMPNVRGNRPARGPQE